MIFKSERAREKLKKPKKSTEKRGVLNDNDINFFLHLYINFIFLNIIKNNPSQHSSSSKPHYTYPLAASCSAPPVSLR